MAGQAICQHAAGGTKAWHGGAGAVIRVDLSAQIADFGAILGGEPQADPTRRQVVESIEIGITPACIVLGLSLRDIYCADAALWRRRWGLFFLATAGLFDHAGGAEWGVSHFRLRPWRSRSPLPRVAQDVCIDGHSRQGD
jgi:hypothetical protein